MESTITKIMTIITMVALIVSVVYGFVISLISFISSIKENKNPYMTYVDMHRNNTFGIRRNYFFGPGSHQLGMIAKGTFKNVGEQGEILKKWKNAHLSNWFFNIWIYIAYLIVLICAALFGFLWAIIFSVILFVINILGEIIFFPLFSLLWLVDRFVLLGKSIHNRCPNCKRKLVIPLFVCPNCGLEHRKLVPGPYGVIKRNCSCGKKLPTTFIGGRSKLDAHCSFCKSGLFSSSSQQYGIQMVGGSGTGKTSYLVAFWHEYKNFISKKKGVTCTGTPADAFMELERWFRNGNTDATTETNATMYSMIHSLGKKTSVQMTIYDIAGEAFDSAGSKIQQQQFRYCEGILVLIDSEKEPFSVSESLTNFINTFNEINGKNSTKTTHIPIAVIITKSDMYKTEIGLPKIKALYKTSGSSDSYDLYQSDVCRDFLFNHYYGNIVNLLEAEFTNIRYFPVSAMGHNGKVFQYEPWGVLEPVFWLMSYNSCPLHNIIKTQ